MSKRTYGQNCALARASDLIGERWTMLMIRDLLVAPRRFNDLLDSLRGIGTNLLAKRLRDLESAGILERADDGKVRLYRVTDRGRALEPAVLALIRWGLLHGPANVEGDHHRDDWDLLALKSVFQAERAEGIDLEVQFEAPGLSGWARVAGGQLTIGLGVISAPDIVIAGTVAELFLAAAEPTRLLAHGDEADLERFTGAFALRA